MSDLPEHALINQQHWNEQAPQWAAGGERAWSDEPTWGIWQIPDAQMPLIPVDMTGLDAIELGCGTAYVSAWMARRGARVVGIDISEGQLSTARRLNDQHGLGLTLLHGSAESVPYPDESFDFAVSEYGAALWCDPYRWLPEAHRLLRPDGQLVFITNSVLVVLCSPLDGSLPITECLERDYFSIYRQDWRDAVDEPGGIEFNLPMSSWIRLFRETGFEIVDFLEPRPHQGGDGMNFFTTADWARRFPSEQIWKLQKS